MLLIPSLVFVYLVLQEGNVKFLVYLFYWIPTIPACTLFVQLATNKNPIYATYILIDASYLSPAVAWIVLFLNIPFWLVVYNYLDAVMPSEYGVNKHPCFCFRKSKPAEASRALNRGDLEEMNDKIFNPNDPIRLEHLTKMFGSFTAVKDLSFSIREGEVFTFLGHNGAGKTTTIFMMTGMLGASSGDA